MPIAENEVTWVQEPRMGLMEQLYLPAIFAGLGTTVRHAARTIFGVGRPVTQQYPEAEPKLPPNYRGVHRLNRDEQGRVKCVACYMCSTACPAHCIDIVAAPSPWPDREKYPETFVIDELRCIYCGMCEQAWPGAAIELTTPYELAGALTLYLLLPRPRSYPWVWGALTGAAALVLGGVLIVRATALNPETVLFYAFSAIALTAGVLLVTQANPARAALSFALVVLA